MAINKCVFLVALFCGGICNPLGQSSVCDSQNLVPGYIQGLPNVATTVCDSTPNLLGLGYGLGLNLPVPFQNIGTVPINSGCGCNTPCDSSNQGLGVGGLGLGGLGGLAGLNGLGGLGGLAGLNGLGGLGGLASLGGLGGVPPLLPTPTTLIDSTPNIGLGLGYGLPYIPNVPGPTTLCDSGPNVGVGYPLSIPRLGLGIPGLGLGLPYGRLPLNQLLLNGLPLGALASVGVM